MYPQIKLGANKRKNRSPVATVSYEEAAVKAASFIIASI
jgi:hypothetical protein